MFDLELKMADSKYIKNGMMINFQKYDTIFQILFKLKENEILLTDLLNYILDILILLLKFIV